MAALHAEAKRFAMQLRYAARSLSQHKLRALLSVLGIICGVSSFVAMVCVGEGARRETLAQIEELGTRNVLIRAAAMSREQAAEARARGSPGVNISDGERLRASIPGIDDVAAVVELTVTALTLTRETAPQVMAVSANLARVLRLRVNAGRFLADQDVVERNSVCVIGHALAASLGQNGRPGATLRLQDSLCHIIGVLQRIDHRGNRGRAIATRDFSDAVLVPLGAIATPQSQRGAVSELIVNLHAAEQVLLALPVIRRLLEIHHHGAEDYRVIVPQELLQQAQRTQETFDWVLASVAAISLLVGGIGIMNVMLASVIERRREIGIRRAVGAAESDILWQFLAESAVLTSVGGVLGLGVGVVCTWLLSAFSGWATAVTAWAMSVPLLMAILTGLFFGLYPALQAAKLDPIAALRDE